LLVPKQDSVGDLEYISKLSQVPKKSNIYAKGRGLFEKDVTNPKKNPFKFVRPLIGVWEELWELFVISDFTRDFFTRGVLPQTLTFNVMP
jgi:hypothetical protein